MGSDKAAAWVWVMENQTIIKKMSYKHCGSFCPDEVFSRLNMECVESFSAFKENKGSAATFIYWRCRKVVLYMKRESEKFLLSDSDALYQRDSDPDSQKKLESKIRVLEILSVATPKQAEACFSVLNGLSGNEVRESLGISVQCRNGHLYRLGSKFDEKRRKANG